MKHVGTGARFRQTVLVTAFGAFPGARSNPTLAILARLERSRSRLARLGIDLRVMALPVVYDSLEPMLCAVADDIRPDAILHLGLAGRRRWLSIETRAVNRAGPLHPDAARRRPAQILARSGTPILRATWPAPRLHAALVRAGHYARLSIDAGDYVCNATLYRSLAAHLAPRVGFLHVSRPRGRVPLAREPQARWTIEAMSEATLAIILEATRAALPRETRRR